MTNWDAAVVDKTVKLSHTQAKAFSIERAPADDRPTGAHLLRLSCVAALGKDQPLPLGCALFKHSNCTLRPQFPRRQAAGSELSLCLPY